MNTEFMKEIYEKPRNARFEYRVLGPIVEHNYLCAVCRERKAVLDCTSGLLTPCWGCRERGYRLIKLGFWGKLFYGNK
jgi:hypothetical protein